jgi:hypothetical protein
MGGTLDANGDTRSCKHRVELSPEDAGAKLILGDVVIAPAARR